MTCGVSVHLRELPYDASSKRLAQVLAFHIEIGLKCALQNHEDLDTNAERNYNSWKQQQKLDNGVDVVISCEVRRDEEEGRKGALGKRCDHRQ